MNSCSVPKYLAFGMAAYCIACAYYMYQTRNVGTPFKDSLTKEQLEIKNQSSKTRSEIFIQGLGIGCAIMFFFDPFKSCFNNNNNNTTGNILTPHEMQDTAFNLPLLSVLRVL
jgi:hypothetical protein